MRARHGRRLEACRQRSCTQIPTTTAALTPGGRAGPRLAAVKLEHGAARQQRVQERRRQRAQEGQVAQHLRGGARIGAGRPSALGVL